MTTKSYPMVDPVFASRRAPTEAELQEHRSSGGDLLCCMGRTRSGAEVATFRASSAKSCILCGPATKPKAVDAPPTTKPKLPARPTPPAPRPKPTPTPETTWETLRARDEGHERLREKLKGWHHGGIPLELAASMVAEALAKAAAIPASVRAGGDYVERLNRIR